MSIESRLRYFYERLTEINSLDETLRVLSYDEQTAMPQYNGESRGRQRALLSRLRHERLTDREFVTTVQKLDSVKEHLSADDGVNVALTWREMQWSLALTPHHVERRERAIARSFAAWREARALNEPGNSLLLLQEVVDCARAEAESQDPHGDPYSTWLGRYERGGTVGSLLPLIERTCAVTRSIVRAAPLTDHESSATEKTPFRMDSDAQLRFCKRVLRRLGFNPNISRFAPSSHPFSTVLGSQDFAITTRIVPDNLLVGVIMAIHEFGHLSYNVARPRIWFGTPRGDAASFAVHESQSRFWENQVGRSLEFCQHLAKDFEAESPSRRSTLNPDDFFVGLNTVRRGPHRLHSDVVSYNHHILIRTTLEAQLIRGELSVKNLPEAWSAEYENEFGFTPKTPIDSYLQDFHWFVGLFGYFPLYTVGTLYAAALYEAISANLKRQGDSVAKCIERNDYRTLAEWLGKHVGEWGATFAPRQLIERACGVAVSEEPFLRYIAPLMQSSDKNRSAA